MRNLRYTLSTTLMAAAGVSIALAPAPAAAFQVGRSPDFGSCNIWFNDQGQPLRNTAGREIGQQVPCEGGGVVRDTYRVIQGQARNTLVIQDESHHLQCLLVLAPGSATVVVPKGCKPYDP